MTEPKDPEGEEIPHRSLLSLIPRRDLTRASMLLLLLVVIVALQRRSGDIVKSISRGLFGPAPAQQVKPPPSVRLAAPPPP